MINSIIKTSKALSFGVLCLILLSACQSNKTPEEITLVFWSAVAKNNLSLAKDHCSSQSQCNISAPLAPIKNATFSYKKIVINGLKASVETEITSDPSNIIIFTSYLIKEDSGWKVDYHRSLLTLTGNQLLNGFFNGLNSLSNTINDQLEQQLPLIENEIRSFGEQLKQQADDFKNDLEKSFPEKTVRPSQSI